jgi:hypothetical protein
MQEKPAAAAADDLNEERLTRNPLHEGERGIPGRKRWSVRWGCEGVELETRSWTLGLGARSGNSGVLTLNLS